MLSSELLRIKINRGRMTPLFCTADFDNGGADYELADKLIVFFTNAQKDRQCKGDLLQKMESLESEYDYKLVRGFFTLLERRSVFVQLDANSSNATPMLIRQKLFEESSRQGWALSGSQRQGIIQDVARQMHVSSEEIETIMWGDKDENLVLAQFDVITAKNLILWYNLSLFQTLLFKCTKLEFHVKGGLHWKQVLRNVKKYGLMYSLEYHTKNNPEGSRGEENSVKCVLEGPLSLFKMTDRYGTSIAKLLPSIVGTPAWKISGSIVRRTEDGQKIYSFELSSESTREFLGSITDSPFQNDDSYVYDSSTEAAFARRFNQHFDQNDRFGWKISREPDPLIADGKAMIPDFLFERFGHKVYFEIVGFWTKDYLERKAAKLEALLGNNNENVDLLVAVNSELSCSSQIEAISKDRIFTFQKDVSIKPILEHLKKIDARILKEKSHVKIRLDEKNPDLISVRQVALDNSLPEEAALKIILRDYPDEYVVAERHLISKKMINSLEPGLEGVSAFAEACKILASQAIPDSCHADLLSRMGYDVVWRDLDPDHAKISKRAG